MLSQEDAERLLRELPAMSEGTMLLNVDALISATFGSIHGNKVDFKLMQRVLHILTRQMNMLEQEVAILDEFQDNYAKRKAAKGEGKDDSRSGSRSGGSREGKGRSKGKGKDSTQTSEQESSGDEARKKKKKKSKEEETEVETPTRTPSPKPSPKDTDGSINVVTASQFDLLVKQVQQLQTMAAPPRPEMPDNQQLMADLAKGTATLPDAMEAMQLSARVEAAEKAVERLLGILGQLIAMGLIPASMFGKLAGLGLDVKALGGGVGGPAKGGPEATDADSEPAPPPDDKRITKIEMANNLYSLKENLLKTIRDMADKAMTVGESASAKTKGIVDKLTLVLKVDKRISELNSLTADYAEQLAGFDAGLDIQMVAYRQQMDQIRFDLKAGIDLLNNASNSESAALQDLRFTYRELLEELARIRDQHNSLSQVKDNLLEGLEEQKLCVDTLRVAKADTEELRDLMRDKAGLNALASLVREAEFERSKSVLESRISMCYDKFNKQDRRWIEAMKELMKIFSVKADNSDLVEIRDKADTEMSKLRLKLDKLFGRLSEPITSFMTRKILKESTRDAGQVATVVLPEDPQLRPKLQMEEEPCVKEVDWGPSPREDDRHICHRYVGGSHTVLNVVREHAKPPPATASSRKYSAEGDDGMMYKFEDICKPCVECNDPAAGDTGICHNTSKTGLMYDAAGDNAASEKNEEKKKDDNKIKVIHPKLPDI